MSRLIDTTICPDCRGALDAAATCSVCGLRVQGPLAAQLWNAMVTADRLIERLRREPVLAPVGAEGSVREAEAGGPLPSYPTRAAPVAGEPAAPRRLPSASVPVVLLSLGALCLLVAAIVFVAVTWGVLGLTGRTLVLLAFTGILAATAVLLTRKALRGAAETFWLVVAGMLTVDLLAAESAGLAGLDALSWRGTGAMVGIALLAMGILVGLWARTQPVTRLYGVQGVASIGALILCATNAWFAENPAIATTVAIPLLAASFVVLRGRVTIAAYGLGGLAAASWLVLLAIGWERALEVTGFGEWWSDFRGWPLLVAALIGAVLVHAPGIPAVIRSVVAGVALVPLVVLANAPDSAGTPTRELLAACATLVALGLVTAFAPKVWALGSAALTSLGIALLGLYLTVGPWEVLSTLDVDGRTDLGTPLLAQDDNPASWSAMVAAAAIVVAAFCLLRQVPAAMRTDAGQVVGTIAPAVLALGALVVVLELEPPLWTGVLAAAIATAIAAGAAWWSRDHLVASILGSVATAYLALVTLYAASAADLLTALTTSALFLVLALVTALRDRVGALASAGVAVVLTALAGGWALVAWGVVMNADTEARTLALAVYAGLAGVVASPLTRRTSTRVALESAAVVLAAVAVGYSTDERVIAMALTIVGTAICLVAVTARDRDLLGWAGAGVLGVATLLRFDADVRAPELYTLPAAALLIAFGAWRLFKEPGTSSFRMLGSGLTLALLPSVLLALDEPVSLRGALIGAAGVLVLAAGVQQRLAAPFILGAATTAILAVRHLEPIADAVPRWISLGGVGMVLLLVGVTWEARRRNAVAAQRYLAALR